MRLANVTMRTEIRTCFINNGKITKFEYKLHGHHTGMSKSRVPGGKGNCTSRDSVYKRSLIGSVYKI